MRAAPDVDTRADIWSLGAILFELVTGRCPFEGESVAVVCSNVLGQEAPSLAECCADAPEQLDAIVHRCLQKDRRDRFQSVADLAGALADFASDAGQRSGDRSWRLASGISLRQSSRPEQRSAAATSRAWPRGSRIALGLSAAAVLAASLMGWRTWVHGSERVSVPARLTPPVAQPPRMAIAAAPALASAAPARLEPTVAERPAITPRAIPAWRASPSPKRAAAAASAPKRATAVARQAPAPVVSAATAKSAAVTVKSAAKSAWDVDRFGGRY
jgi:serine/threonine-protein kinase